MLCVDSYTQKHVDECRSRIAAQDSAYRSLIAAARKPAGTAKPALDAAIEAFEPQYFNNLVLALDSCFVHRTRALGKKDGNPLNEVWMLCSSIVNTNGKLCADKTAKYDPTRAVLKYRFGDEIKVNEADFVRLSEAFLAEVESKYL